MGSGRCCVLEGRLRVHHPQVGGRGRVAGRGRCLGRVRNPLFGLGDVIWEDAAAP